MILLRFVLIALAALFISSPATANTWYRADTHHFVIYSDGGERQLTDFAHKAEKFDALLRALFGKKPEVLPNRLTIYLLGNSSNVRALAGKKRGNVAGFYRPLPEGSYAVANRERTRDYGLDGQTVLFHEYAHHFMYRNLQAPAPPWFSEGFAEYMSTAEFNRDGSWSFGRAAKHRAYSLVRGKRIKIRTLLTEKPSGSSLDVSAFYGWAWALTHMMYESGDNGLQMQNYLQKLNGGEDALQAAEDVFGNLDDLEDKLHKYITGKIGYSRASKPLPYLSDIKVERLSKYHSELIELTLHRKHNYKRDKTREELVALSRHRDADADIWYQIAKLEYDDAHRADAEPRYDFTASIAAAGRALTMQPDHLMANVLMGDLLLEPFDHDQDFDPAAWDKARHHYGIANRKDPLNPYPLFKFGQSFLREGKDNDQIGLALDEAFFAAPEAEQIRFALAQHYQQEGEYDKAIALIKIIAGNPHRGSGPRRMIEALENARDGGFGFVLPFENKVEDIGDPDDEDSSSEPG